jgi:hypothetical protein
MKDLTRASAAKWVEQEIASTIARDAVAQRIVSEMAFIEQLKQTGLDAQCPNSFTAHTALVERLRNI